MYYYSLVYTYRFSGFPEPVNKQKKYYVSEGVFLIMAIVVDLLTGAALAISLLLWLQVIPIQTATPEFHSSTGIACPCDGEQCTGVMWKLF